MHSIIEGSERWTISVVHIWVPDWIREWNLSVEDSAEPVLRARQVVTMMAFATYGYGQTYHGRSRRTAGKMRMY